MQLNAQQGITYIEIIIATAILSITCLSILKFQQTFAKQLQMNQQEIQNLCGATKVPFSSKF